MKLSVNRVIIVTIAAFVLVSVTMFTTAGHPKLSTGPTLENALAADQELAKALQNNDTLGIVRMLDKDWAVITSFGDTYEGSDAYTGGVRSGQRILTALELTEPRVRLFGDVAVVTAKSRLAILLHGKPMEFHLCQTDTWVWKDGAWICILTQESGPKKQQ
jgi:ketosteroid isomerase-like protein